jgi:hypothetical protein
MVSSMRTTTLLPAVLFVLASDTHLQNARALVPVLRDECRLISYALDVRAFFYGSSFTREVLDSVFEKSAVLVKEDFRTRGIIDRLASGIGRFGLRQPARFLRRGQLASLLTARFGNAIAACILCNDRCFPERDVLKIFRAHGIPCFLVQESLRKDLQMSESAGPKHGTGGADQIFAWGETSREYFRAVRVPEDRILITGNPRFDRFRSSCAAVDPAASRARWGLPDAPAILLATNPVYSMNMKDAPSAEDCLRTIESVVSAATALGRLVIWKPHPLEKTFTERSDVQSLLVSQSANLRLSWEMTLPEAIAVCDRALVFNSTVALEAASMGRPAGLLALKPWNHGVDFVDRGIARLLDSPTALTAFLTEENPLQNLEKATSAFTPLDGQSAQRIATGIKLAMIMRKHEFAFSIAPASSLVICLQFLYG